MAGKQKSTKVRLGGASYVGWRAELIAQTALSRFPDLSVHKPTKDSGYDFLVTTPTQMAFVVVVKGFSSAAQGLRDVEHMPVITWAVKGRHFFVAFDISWPVVLFLIDADTGYGRYLRIDNLITEGRVPDGPPLGFPLENTLDADGLRRLLVSIGGVPPDRAPATLGASRATLKATVKEFEELLGNPKTGESDIQGFFEKHPSLLQETLGTGREVFANVSLHDPKGDTLRPDFIIKPRRGENWTIVEVKRPNCPALVGRGKRRRLSAEVARALAQVRKYKSYFDSSANRGRLSSRLGIDIAAPKAVIVIGRSLSELCAHERRELQAAGRDIEILDYDMLLDRLKDRVE